MTSIFLYVCLSVYCLIIIVCFGCMVLSYSTRKKNQVNRGIHFPWMYCSSSNLYLVSVSQQSRSKTMYKLTKLGIKVS